MTMKLVTAAVAATMVFANPASAASIAGLFNTGVDSASAVLGGGTADLHYILNSGATTPFTYNNGSYVQSLDSTWIAADAGGGYVVNPNTYSLSFDLTGFDYTTASLSGLFAADNSGTVRLNGNLLASTGTYNAFTAFSATSFFVAGINVLSFSVVDTGQPSALNVSALSGTVELAGPSGVPEPATWAMMIGGFALAGAAMRRRMTGVSFA